ncbi:MAG: hypothetical protein RI907_3084 [Pseudomonadota bacterium]|jgi:DedD protein
MPLPSFLQRFRRDGQANAAPDLPAAPGLDVEAARTRARRRLIGMLVLVVAGVLGFPWLFETQPRPMSHDVAVVQAPGQGNGPESAPTASGNRAPLTGRVEVAAITPPAATESPAATPPANVPMGSDGGQPGREIEETVAAQPASVPKTAVAKPAPKPAASAPPAKPADKKPQDTKPSPAKPVEHKEADKKPADKKPADKKPEPPKDAKAADKADTRYVVQFGAFADAASAQSARAKVEKLGIKTYAQTVDTPAGKRTRVRIGPFANKAEAEKANAALRKAGMTGSVLIL